MYNAVSPMRGQVSLELLMVLAVFLLLLIFALGALNKIELAESNALNQRYAALAFSDISKTAETVCILGDGNRQTVEVGISDFSLTGSNKELQMDWNSQLLPPKNIGCDFGTGGPFSNQVTITNNKGVVEFS